MAITTVGPQNWSENWSKNWSENHRLATAVLAATDLNLLNCESSQVACGTRYCCRPVVEVGVGGGEYTSARSMKLVQLTDLLTPWYGLRYLRTSSRCELADTRVVAASWCPLRRTLSTTGLIRAVRR